MLQEFATPLAINQCKLGDTLVFQANEQTPLDFQLTIRDMDGAIIYGPISWDVERNGVLYWHVVLSAANGFEVQTYYEVTVSDDLTNEVADVTWLVYVNNEKDFEDYLTRALGLAGQNLRRYGHTWTNGQLTSFSLKLYSTAADLDAALAGTADTYIAYYVVTLTYDQNYNCIELSSVKQ